MFVCPGADAADTYSGPGGPAEPDEGRGGTAQAREGGGALAIYLVYYITELKMRKSKLQPTLFMLFLHQILCLTTC